MCHDLASRVALSVTASAAVTRNAVCDAVSCRHEGRCLWRRHLPSRVAQSVTASATVTSGADSDGVSCRHEGRCLWRRQLRSRGALSVTASAAVTRGAVSVRRQLPSRGALSLTASAAVTRGAVCDGVSCRHEGRCLWLRQLPSRGARSVTASAAVTRAQPVTTSVAVTRSAAYGRVSCPHEGDVVCNGVSCRHEGRCLCWRLLPSRGALFVTASAADGKIDRIAIRVCLESDEMKILEAAAAARKVDNTVTSTGFSDRTDRKLLWALMVERIIWSPTAG